MTQDRSILYIRTRETLRALDPNLSVHALAALARAVIAADLAHMSRRGHVALVTEPRS